MDKPYRRPIQVLVYCFRRGGRHLEYPMLRRTPKYGGFWQSVTGAPEIDESLLDGARRELLEETKFVPIELWQVEFGYSFPVDDEWKWAYDPTVTMIEEYVFLAEIAFGVEPVLSFEHNAHEWAGYDRAIAIMKWPNNIAALKFCDQLLRREFQETG